MFFFIFLQGVYGIACYKIISLAKSTTSSFSEEASFKSCCNLVLYSNLIKNKVSNS